MDETLPWCTYRTTHSSGFYYFGKAKTTRVLDGSYKGSGIRFKLAMQRTEYSYDTWVTVLDNTFATEAEAYAAEELLVPLNLLSDPFCLNMNAGGLKGKYQTHGRLFQQINSVKRAENKAKKAAKAKEKLDKLKSTIKALKGVNGKTKKDNV